MSAKYNATHCWETIYGMTDIRCPCHKGRKSRPEERETPNLLRQMHLSESSVFVRAEMTKLAHSEALLFSSWAAWWDGAQSMLSLFSFYPQHTPEISAPSHIFWRRAQRSLLQILSLVPLKILSLEANIWSWESLNREHWWGIGVLHWNTCDLMWCIIIKSRLLCPNGMNCFLRTEEIVCFRKAKRITSIKEAKSMKQRLYWRAKPDLQRPRASWHRPSTLALSCPIQQYW